MVIRTSIVLTILALLTAPLYAQEGEGWNVTSLTVSSGEDALSSGVSGSIWFAKRRQVFNLAVQPEQAWVLWGKRFSLGAGTGEIAGTAGHFKGEPWAGPYLSYDIPLGKVSGQKVSISTLQWLVWNAWEPDEWKNDGVENPESLYLGIFTGYQVSIGPVGIFCSFLNFLDDPWNKLPGVSYTQSIRKDFSVSASATWNTTDKKWMFHIGGTWAPGS